MNVGPYGLRLLACADDAIATTHFLLLSSSSSKEILIYYKIFRLTNFLVK